MSQIGNDDASTSGHESEIGGGSTQTHEKCVCPLLSLFDFGEVLPDAYWNDVYRNFSPAVQENPFKAFFIPRRTGLEYGNPRNYGMNFTQFLFQLYVNQWNQQRNNQKPPKACVTVYGPKGPDTACDE